MRGYRGTRAGSGHSSVRQRQREKKDIRNSRNFGTGLALLTGFAVFAVLILAFALFFKVDVIEVYGNNRYTTDELIQESGFQRGDNLYLFNKYGKIQRMFAKLPYLKEVRIRRSLPDTIRIEVEEREARLAVFADSGIWIISADGKILEQAEDKQGPDGYSWVYGLTLEKAAVGQNLSESEESGVKALTGLLNAMETEGVTDKLGDIDLSEDYNIQFTYEGRFLVSTGMPEELHQKVVYLEEVIGRLTVAEMGTISLGGEQIRFVPTEKVPVLQVENSSIERPTENGSDAAAQTETETEEISTESQTEE